MRGGLGMGFGRRPRMRRPSFLAGATLDQGFVRGVYRGATPAQITTTRASTGYAQNSAGLWVPYATNVARLNDRGLTNENTKTNAIRNNTMVGAVNGTVGSGGALPTNWSFGAQAGLTWSVVGTGNDGGIDYIDIRAQGTVSGAPAILYFETNNGIAAAQSQTWADSFFIKQTAGSQANITAFQRYVVERPSGSGGALTSFTAPTTSWQRVTGATTLSQVGTANVHSGIALQMTNAAAIDITLRIGWPQLEQGAFASTPIPTSGTAATRATDINRLAGVNFSSWYTGGTSGTFYVEVELPPNFSGNPLLFMVNDGTSSNGHYVEVNSAGSVRFRTLVASADQGTVASAAAVTPSSIIKAAIAFAPGDRAISVNGGAVVTGAGSMPAALSELRIGDWVNGGNSLDGAVRRLAYIPSRVGNTALQGLSS